MSEYTTPDDDALELETDGTLADADPNLADDPNADTALGDEPVDGAQAATDASPTPDEPAPVTPSSTPRQSYVRTLHEDVINAGAERFAQEARQAYIAAKVAGNDIEFRVTSGDGDVDDFDGDDALRQYARDHADDYNPNVDNSTVEREEARLNAGTDDE